MIDNVVPFRKLVESAEAPSLRFAAAAAALALVFVGGLIAGGFLDTPPQQIAQEKPGWRESAARYVSLFSKETLEGFAADPASQYANLQRASKALSLDLSGDQITNPALSFQGHAAAAA